MVSTFLLSVLTEHPYIYIPAGQINEAISWQGLVWKESTKIGHNPVGLVVKKETNNTFAW